MSYKVTGAAAVVEMDDGNPELNTGTKLYIDEGVAVPEGVKKASIEHLLNVGLIAEADAKPGDGDDGQGSGGSSKSAAKADKSA